jgi:hypothetical protein
MNSLSIAAVAVGGLAAFLCGAETARWGLSPLTERLAAQPPPVTAPAATLAFATADDAAPAPPPVVARAQPVSWSKVADDRPRTDDADVGDPPDTADPGVPTTDGVDHGEEPYANPLIGTDGLPPITRPADSADGPPADTGPDR